MLNWQHRLETLTTRRRGRIIDRDGLKTLYRGIQITQHIRSMYIKYGIKYFVRYSIFDIVIYTRYILHILYFVVKADWCIIIYLYLTDKSSDERWPLIIGYLIRILKYYTII